MTADVGRVGVAVRGRQSVAQGLSITVGVTADVGRVGVAVRGRQSVAQGLSITVGLTLQGTLEAVQPATAERTVADGGCGRRGARTVLRSRSLRPVGNGHVSSTRFNLATNL